MMSAIGEKEYGQVRVNPYVIPPGSWEPLATTESKPGGGFFKELSSLVMVCSLPKATSLRNINPKPWEGLAAKSKNFHMKGMASQTISYKNNISDLQ